MYSHKHPYTHTHVHTQTHTHTHTHTHLLTYFPVLTMSFHVVGFYPFPMLLRWIVRCVLQPWRTRGGRANHLHRVEVGCHDDLVEGSRQLGGQLGFLVLALRCGEIVQPRPGKEVIDHTHTVVLACNENGNGLSQGVYINLTRICII